ncbi:hypothetical protein OnM2_066047 [Erysiphe neolycopersici]|uniref:Uncharacterized protein n=1 Tax=Erysiphe neolycopersici TaxID=212602 RepID=A0A420HMM2_9PEZI|nr:hypothetical protein OnM2_066047 [Erysiphe neolycopersici]
MGECCGLGKSRNEKTKYLANQPLSVEIVDKEETTIIQFLPIEIMYNSPEGLEHFSVVVNQENKRSVKENLQEAYAEVVEIQTSRK